MSSATSKSRSAEKVQRPFMSIIICSFKTGQCLSQASYVCIMFTTVTCRVTILKYFEKIISMMIT